MHVDRFARMFVLLFFVSLPTVRDPGLARLHAALPEQPCAAVRSVDSAGLIESLNQAYTWNGLLDQRVAAVKHHYFSSAAVLAKIESWISTITCMAREFTIPPELLAGILATELDLDYHLADAVVDNVIRASPFGELLGYVEMGAGYAGVHFDHVRRALATFTDQLSNSPFFDDYCQIIIARSNAALTVLATRDSLFDITDAAVMARYYARLRLGNRPMSSLTVTDMAFIWSAYRGGVKDSPADLPVKREYRWSVDYLQRADNPQIFGDTLIALPYFNYYKSVFRSS